MTQPIHAWTKLERGRRLLTDPAFGNSDAVRAWLYANGLALIEVAEAALDPKLGEWSALGEAATRRLNTALDEFREHIEV